MAALRRMASRGGIRSIPDPGAWQREQHLQPGPRAVFFCYRVPAGDKTVPPEQAWQGEAGRTGWYLCDIGSEKIARDAPRIADVIRRTLETPRHRARFAPRSSSQSREVHQERLPQADPGARSQLMGSRIPPFFARGRQAGTPVAES